ncbi:MAG: class I SAM-dependent rRNA methyltransferase [Nitrospirae bacterium]|nr:class I SAM-dependent rRNA methyltransferase [Nitrospirota bacterium]
MRSIKLRTSKRILGGHLWVFSNEVASSLKGYEKGELVEVYDKKGGFLGIGYINPESLIAIRLLSRRKVNIDKEFFKRRITEALRYRMLVYPEEKNFRVVFSDSDLLPGLIVDKFGSTLVVQILTAGMDRLRNLIFKALDEVLEPETIVAKNDSSFRAMEGLKQECLIIKGSLDKQPVVNEGGFSFEIDVLGGQKTGYFLDQRENRLAFASLVRGGIGVDLFSYVGAWGIQLASKADRVICVDSSDDAVRLIKRNAELNNLSHKIDALCEDAFEFLNRARDNKKRFDFIVVDPPAFVKSRASLSRAISGYKALNANAMVVLKKGGLMATSSCSYHISTEDFLDIIRYAARVTNRYVRIIEYRSQAKDHPFLVSMPETRYLKCAILQVF